MEVVLDENGVLEYTKTNIPKPLDFDPQAQAQWKKDTKKLGELFWRVLEIMWFRTCMERRLLLKCGRLS